MRERTKHAATIIAWLQIPHEIAKAMSEDEIMELVEHDHYPIRKADKGPDVHWNLRPLLVNDHKIKTKADAADMAKERKVRRAYFEHLDRMRLKRLPHHRRSHKRSLWPSRPFPKRKKP